MSKSFSVQTIFKAVNHMTSPMSAMSRSVSAFGKETQNTGTKTKSVFHGIVQSLHSVSQALTSTKAKFKFHNELQKVRELARSFRELGSTIAGIAKPGFGTLAIGAAGAYAGTQLVQNSSTFEQQKTRTKGLMMSDDKNKGMSEKDLDTKVTGLLKQVQDFSDSQVGEYGDWVDFTNNNLARGIEPSEKLLKATGSLAAVHKGGMPGLIETWNSGARGEVAALDQIPGLQGHTKNGAVELVFKGEKYNLGQKDSKDYYKNFIKAMEAIAEKNFSAMGALQGKTFDAKWSTLVSSFKNAFDTAFTSSGWFDFVKEQVDKSSNYFKQLTPRITSIFKGFFDNFQGKTGLLDSISQSFTNLTNIALRELDNLLKSIANNDSSTSTALKSFFDSLPSKFEGIITSLKSFDWDDAATKISTTASNVMILSSAFVSLINNIAPLIQFLQHPWDTTLGSLQETTRLTKNTGDMATQTKESQEKYYASLSPKERLLIDKRQKEEDEKRNIIRSAPFTSVLKNEVSQNIANSVIPDKQPAKNNVIPFQPVDPINKINIQNNPAYPSILAKPQILNPVQQKQEPTKVESTNNITIKVEDNRAPTVTTQSSDNGTKSQTNVKNVGKNRRTN